MSWLEETKRIIADKREEGKVLQAKADLATRAERERVLAEWNSHASIVATLGKKWNSLGVERILGDLQREFYHGAETSNFKVWFKEIDGDHFMYLEWQGNKWEAVWYEPNESIRYWMPPTKSAEGGTIAEALSKTKYKPGEIEFSCFNRGLYEEESKIKDTGDSSRITTHITTSFAIGMNTREITCQTASGKEEVLASLEEIGEPRDLERKIDHFLAQDV